MYIVEKNSKKKVDAEEWFEFESYGKIIYDPPRPGMKKNKDWWVIFSVDREITRYFRWQILWNWGIKLYQPSWDAHISIIRGERPANDKMHLWKKFHGQKFKFKYSNKVFQADNKPEFWYIHAQSPIIKEIREDFGFQSDWTSHITVGKTC